MQAQAPSSGGITVPAPDLPPLSFWQRFLAALGTFLRLLLVPALMIFTLLIPVWIEASEIVLPDFFSDYLVVMLLGALVGFVEIVSRYQDAPFRTVVTWPGLTYIWINALVAASALWMLRTFGWSPEAVAGDPLSAEAARWAEVIGAGLGAMALFRSSLFVLGKEDKETSVGPSAVLQVLLAAIDREVDRLRGQERARIVANDLKEVPYDSVKGELMYVSQRLMQNLSDAERKAIIEATREIEVESTDPEVRKYLLGLKLIEFVGQDILRQAISIRGKDYYKNLYTPPTARPSVAEVRNAYAGALENNPASLPGAPSPNTPMGRGLEPRPVSKDPAPPQEDTPAVG